MKKAAVLISVLLAVCSLSACESTKNTPDTSVTSSAQSVVTSSDTTTDSVSDTETSSGKETSSKNTSSKKEESKKDESKKDTSKKNESKKKESKPEERGDVIPSRSNEYEATPNTESKKSEKKTTDTDTATDTDTVTDTDTSTEEFTDNPTDTEEKPEPPYLSGLWIVEKIIDADGKEVDGRDIYGAAFNYAGVLDLNEEGEFELTIGIIPEGQVNSGLYEQREDVLVLQYDDGNYTQVFLDVTELDGIEVLAFPVTTGGKNYTIYFSR